MSESKLRSSFGKIGAVDDNNHAPKLYMCLGNAKGEQVKKI